MANIQRNVSSFLVQRQGLERERAILVVKRLRHRISRNTQGPDLLQTAVCVWPSSHPPHMYTQHRLCSIDRNSLLAKFLQSFFYHVYGIARKHSREK